MFHAKIISFVEPVSSDGSSATTDFFLRLVCYTTLLVIHSEINVLCPFFLFHILLAHGAGVLLVVFMISFVQQVVFFPKSKWLVNL